MMGGGTHQLGTTRMAAKADDGVVNEYLAIHEMTNLFVASSSVFLTSSQANPTFMVIVLALRLADRLTKEFISRPTLIVLSSSIAPLDNGGLKLSQDLEVVRYQTGIMRQKFAL
jgi:choline dehydrogenase-like flavoprotein